MMIKNLAQLQEQGHDGYPTRPTEMWALFFTFLPIPFWWLDGRIRCGNRHITHVKVGGRSGARRRTLTSAWGAEDTFRRDLLTGEWKAFTHACMPGWLIESFAAPGVGCCCSRCHYLEELLLDWSADHSGRACLDPSLPSTTFEATHDCYSCHVAASKTCGGGWKVHAAH